MGTDHFEIERKYLISYPDIDMLNSCADQSEIIQTYLVNPVLGGSARVRRRGFDGKYIYTHTEKKKISDIRRIELEREITEAEYKELLKTADPERNVIYKTRYCLDYSGQIFEIDVYPFWDDRAIMEIELQNEGQKIQFPPNIHIIAEVTSDKRYTNSSLAKHIPYDAI